MTRHLFLCLALTAVVLTPELLFAATTLETELGGGLCKIVQALTGKAGRAIASIGIIILGISAFFGKVNWGLSMTVAVGIMAIFSSMKIAEALGGGTTGCT